MAYSSSFQHHKSRTVPKVSAILSCTPVSETTALDFLTTFLESEQSKLSHLDLQPYWNDLHSVALTIGQHHHHHHDPSSLPSSSSRATLERLRSNMDLHTTTSYATSSPEAKHVVFANDHHDETIIDTPSTTATATGATKRQHDDHAPNNHAEDKEARKQAKRAKKERKKEAKKKKERKEAKKRKRDQGAQ